MISVICFMIFGFFFFYLYFFFFVSFFLFFFFFFQAEDGIRDRDVTGVQTCALPIYAGGAGARLVRLAPRPGGTDRGPGARVQPRRARSRLGPRLGRDPRGARPRADGDAAPRRQTGEAARRLPNPARGHRGARGQHRERGALRTRRPPAQGWRPPRPDASAAEGRGAHTVVPGARARGEAVGARGW